MCSRNDAKAGPIISRCYPITNFPPACCSRCGNLVFIRMPRGWGVVERKRGCSQARTALSLSRDAAPEFNRLHFETTAKLISPRVPRIFPSARSATPVGAGRLILFKASKPVISDHRLRFIARRRTILAVTTPEIDENPVVF